MWKCNKSLSGCYETTRQLTFIGLIMTPVQNRSKSDCVAQLYPAPTVSCSSRGQSQSRVTGINTGPAFVNKLKICWNRAVNFKQLCHSRPCLNFNHHIYFKSTGASIKSRRSQGNRKPSGAHLPPWSVNRPRLRTVWCGWRRGGKEWCNVGESWKFWDLRSFPVVSQMHLSTPQHLTQWLGIP